jgi:predicted Abi (CAAX) family protease
MFHLHPHLTVIPRAEKAGAYADTGGAFFYGNAIIIRHPHTEDIHFSIIIVFQIYVNT